MNGMKILRALFYIAIELIGAYTITEKYPENFVVPNLVWMVIVVGIYEEGNYE